MRTSISLRLLGAAIALSAPVNAQIALEESMTNWTVSAPTGWTLDATASGSKGKLVDRLDTATAFTTMRTVTTLKRGWYVATCRLMKFKDEKGAADLSLEVISGSRVIENTIPFTQIGELDSTTNTYKWVGKWFYMQPVVFEVKADNAPAIFRVSNNDAKVTKQNLYFDWFKIGKIPEGKVLKYQSLDNGYAPWSGAWLNSTTWFSPNTPEPASAFGEVAITNGVNWFDHHSWYGWNANQPKHDMILQPGTYTMNWRVFAPSTGKWDLLLRYNINGAGFQTTTWAAAEQKSGKWILSPNVSFKITQKDSAVRFRFGNTTSGGKYGYKIDAFLLRKGAFDVSGTACSSSLGKLSLSGDVPQLGETFTVSVDNTPNVAVFILGATQQAIDLSKAGMPGCTLYTDLLQLSAGVATNNVASSTFTIPPVPALIGVSWRQQAMVLDSKANAFGLALSDVGQALIQN